MLVFGGASVNEMLRNWAIHVQRLQVPYAVACMDESPSPNPNPSPNRTAPSPNRNQVVHPSPEPDPNEP